MRWPSEVLPWAKGQDAQALGLTLAELFFSSLARSGPGERTSRTAIRRLMEDVFEGDMARAREFCTEEDDWADAVALLDAGGGGGWGLLGELLSGNGDLGAVLRRFPEFLLGDGLMDEER